MRVVYDHIGNLNVYTSQKDDIMTSAREVSLIGFKKLLVRFNEIFE